MEGRWTIHKRGWGHLVAPTDLTDVEPGSWPVVPCDDAAIERAAAKLRELGVCELGRASSRVAEAVLRAAGQTP